MSIPIDRMIKMTRTKDCVDCRWHIPNGAFDKCGEPRAVNVDPVTGERTQQYRFTQREIAVTTGCGPQGMYWQPRTEQEAA